MNPYRLWLAKIASVEPLTPREGYGVYCQICFKASWDDKPKHEDDCPWAAISAFSESSGILKDYMEQEARRASRIERDWKEERQRQEERDIELLADLKLKYPDVGDQ